MAPVRWEELTPFGKVARITWGIVTAIIFIPIAFVAAYVVDLYSGARTIWRHMTLKNPNG